MKKAEYYYKTKSVIVYLDEDVKDIKEAYTKAYKILAREVLKYESDLKYDSNR